MKLIQGEKYCKELAHNAGEMMGLNRRGAEAWGVILSRWIIYPCSVYFTKKVRELFHYITELDVMHIVCFCLLLLMTNFRNKMRGRFNR
jgi:hypothetical protein